MYLGGNRIPLEFHVIWYKQSVILSEASGQCTFPVAVGQAESKDLGGIFGAPGIKVAPRPRQGGDAAMSDGDLVRL
jgi:hypothetical protein